MLSLMVHRQILVPVIQVLVLVLDWLVSEVWVESTALEEQGLWVQMQD